MMLESVTVMGSCRPQWRTCKVWRCAGVEVWRQIEGQGDGQPSVICRWMSAGTAITGSQEVWRCGGVEDWR